MDTDRFLFLRSRWGSLFSIYPLLCGSMTIIVSMVMVVVVMLASRAG